MSLPHTRPHSVIVNFGASVGHGACCSENLAGSDEPDAQCWFEIVDGPAKGKLVMCHRRQIGDMKPPCTMSQNSQSGPQHWDRQGNKNDLDMNIALFNTFILYINICLINICRF